MPSFAKNGHEKRDFCPSTFNLKLKESYLKVGGHTPEYVITQGDGSHLGSAITIFRRRAEPKWPMHNQGLFIHLPLQQKSCIEFGFPKANPPISNKKKQGM